MKDLKALQATLTVAHEVAEAETPPPSNAAAEAPTTEVEQSPPTSSAVTEETAKSPEWLRREQIEEQIEDDLLPFEKEE
jgi:hypothetical protein